MVRKIPPHRQDRGAAGRYRRKGHESVRHDILGPAKIVLLPQQVPILLFDLSAFQYSPRNRRTATRLNHAIDTQIKR